MSLGMLKLFKLFILAILVTFFSGCLEKENYSFFNTQKPIIKQGKEKIIKQKVEKKKVEKKIVKKIIKKKIEKKSINKVPKKAIKPKIKKIVKVVIQPKKVKHQKEVNTNKTIKVKKKKLPIKKEHYAKTSSILKKENLDEFAFDFIKKGKLDNNTLLIVGGIQGDEPGGFMAASLISTHYKITKGSVWVVPNLNFYSIIKRNRGPFGDMNRKFAYLPKSDPEYKIIQRLKQYITDPRVKLIVNLHDGSGFYRPMYIDRMHQPLRWGQSSVIDQEILPNVKKYADTYTISEQVVKHINKHLLKPEDVYRTKNTHTRFEKTFEEKEMAKTLTYFAVTHGKAAFGHETSKSLTVAQRVYYKLLALEKYMDIMGIKYTRKFPLTITGIKHALNDNINIIFNDTHIKMPLSNIRNIQKYFPIDSKGKINYFPSNPLIKIIKKGKNYIVYYGNRRLTTLEADYKKHLNFKTKVTFKVDGKLQKVKFGDTLNIKNNFLVLDDHKFRVNVIGYKNKSGIETNHYIKRQMIAKRFSVERKGRLYRVEFYKGKKFAGMVLVNYIK